MPSTKKIEAKVLDYLSHMSEARKKVLLSVAETLAKAEEPEESYLTAEQVEELDRRWDAYKKGKMKTHDWETLKKEIERSLKLLKRK